MRRIRLVKIHFPDRRVLPDRRLDMHRSRLYFPPSETPWLCFESEDVRRRLKPLPEDWVVRDDAALEALCAQAEVQRVRTPRRVT